MEMTLIIKAFILSLFTYQVLTVATERNPTLYKVVVEDTLKPVLYLYVDQLPKFKGGSDSLNEFVRKNFTWPKEDICFEGTIMTSFIIEKDGIVNNVKTIPSHCLPCEREAIRLISKMPSWIPGKVKNRTVRTIIYFPVKFILEE